MYIYITDAAGVIIGPVELPVIPGIGIQVPSNAIQLGNKLAQPEAGKAWALVDGHPNQLADHRGTVYRTDTGEPVQHTALGDLPAHLTTAPRPSEDHSWSGSTWSLDAELAKANHQALSARLCQSIDTAADAARARVAGDPLRAVEYDRARIEAHAFADAGYPADAVPRTVAAWAINGRTARQAADSILAEAAAYTEALYAIRETRLAAKEQIRTLMDAGEVEQAQQLAEQTIAAIEAAVAGVGNAAA
ncbi:hypothetical protein [Stenotrophomonas sp.]|uniref:hypothetical protein n=1 Tax=Stenotrophomonas sp. TaxID=69392 RepID=UPI0028A5CF53|nr:hypothetical protein [Stenotrophomonas sp.]